MKRPAWLILSVFCSIAVNASVFGGDGIFVPALDGDPWVVAGNPDLGPLTGEKQQPVDFGVWQASDGSWQLWSCIRSTKETGNTRLFYRWQGDQLDRDHWTPMGVAMRADAALGETPGGLQAPHVIRIRGEYFMFYGDWVNIRIARGWDGKTFARWLTSFNRDGLFNEGAESNARDPMVIDIDGLYHCYYTAHPQRKGAVYCRTSIDLIEWSPAKIVASGGQAGTEFYSAECPHVVRRGEDFYLLRTQRYGENAITRVYRSTDPMEFGVNDDRCLIGSLPVAAPEIIQYDGRWFIAYLKNDLHGIQIARLKWDDAAR
ncbi:MAG: hypothetical protein GC154_19625 [bacterium]|nr:hypothetical protein [bacterium]